MAKTWFITGASKGLGREWAIAALDRGDRVAIAARNFGRLTELADEYGELAFPIALDVSDRGEAFAAVAAAHDRFGGLDVVVNNAGYGQYGMVEELTEQEARAIMDTNFFGALWVTQASLPFLRAAGSGHILLVSSVGGLIAAAGLSIYHATKWALEGLSQALAQEVRDFGIKVTIVEPTGYRTAAEGAARRSTPVPGYEKHLERMQQLRRQMESREGDPEATRSAILEVVDADDPPLRILLGAGALQTVTKDYEGRLATWRRWESVSVAAHGTRPTSGV
jgi:NAD(P)-dependent dehydrogenase (short-subunit alcohol dehydrogenase family)